jgi:thiamine monophosphate kinase
MDANGHESESVTTEDTYDADAERFYADLDDLCRKYAMKLTSGDVSRLLMIQANYTMLGEVPP